MDTGIFQKFKSATGYNIQPFFQDFLTFTGTYYPIIVKYYKGESVDVKTAFKKLDDLLEETKKIEPLFELKQNQLSGIDSWYLLDIFTDCQTQLWSIDNSSRWLRSSTLDRYGSGSYLERALKTRESFENVAREISSASYEDSWTEISRKNLISEEDYTVNDGSAMFKLNLQWSGNSPVENIVDNLVGEKILGKDISTDFEFEDNDLKRVEAEKACSQALNTILSSIQGSIPEFPEYGFSRMSYGVSEKALSYPTIFKNLLDMFSRDLRWKEVQILDLYKKDDCIFVKISAKTITNDAYVTNIKI